MLNALFRWMSHLLGRGGAVWDGGPGAAVLLVGRDGRILEAGDTAPALLGLPRSLLIGATLGALVEEETREGVERALRLGGSAGRAVARLHGETPRAIDLAMRERPDGARAVVITLRPEVGNMAGDMPGDAHALRAEADAARREAEAARCEANAARSDAKERADLLADLSHEMRTPLNAVIGFADAMKEETFGPLGHHKYGEYARHIRASGGHLLDLVSSILDLAKIEADRFALKREIVDAGDLARECAGIIRLSAEKAGLKLIVRIADELPDASLDARAVRQILLNLLSNAVKFTSDGEVAIDVRARGEDIVMTVTDTGVGMSEAELSRLGARFTSASGDGVRGAKGNGLGLALAFALAELHGGSMKLESAPGEGMRATVKLPIRESAAPARLRTAPSTDNPFARGRLEKAADPALIGPPVVLTQLERIEAYRRERQKSAA